MERSVSLVQNMFAGSSQNYSAGLVALAAIKLNKFILSDHDFLDAFGMAQNFLAAGRLVESRNKFGTSCNSQSFNSFEIGVFDHHYSLVGEKLFRVIVYELTVHEHVGFILEDFVNLLFHFFSFSLLDFSHFVHRVHFDFCSIDFDLVIVHRSIGTHDFAISHFSGTANRNSFFHDEPV
jgi:hypothetical protein